MLGVSAAADLYERYGKPLEGGQLGQYVAIYPDGKTVIAGTMADVANQAVERFGAGAVIFKIGEGAAGKWRTIASL